MKRRIPSLIRFSFRTLLLATLIFTGSLSIHAAGPIHFTVNVAPSLAGPGKPLTGRLLIFMTNNPKPLETIEPDFSDPNAVFITGLEVSNFDPVTPIEIDPDLLAFPRPFSAATAGEYQVMALLDRDHSYTYDAVGPGDFYSAVVKSTMPSAETVLTLSKEVPARKISDVPGSVKIVDFQSPMLSAFWGRPVTMQATVVLPPGYELAKLARYPAVYNVHGYGGSNLKISGGLADLLKGMKEGKHPEMIYVYLNAQCSLGHHVFADSANNGPWGSALVQEFIPYLEKQFRMDGKPSGRFLTGHSSGGWSTMWVMVTHPDFFGGTWSTSPDPLDFRSFTGPDITKEPPQNAYLNDRGKEYNLVRMGGKELMSLKQYAQQEAVLGYFGGQMASFDAVFSPKGPDGQPMPLFDRKTGRIDPLVQKTWEKYDISRLLRDNWKTLGPKLKGKIHIIVGTADTFHLDEPARLLDAELKKLGSDARFEYLEGLDHFNLYQGGLDDRIAKEMYAVARPTAKAKGGR